MWLWFESDYWSFDEGSRLEAFSEYQDDSQFSEVAAKLTVYSSRFLGIVA